MKKDELLWVTYAKGLGIILVVFGHILLGLLLTDLSINHALYEYILSFLYSFHMPLFFVLSGLFFEGSLTKRKNKKDFIVDKLKTLIYPYVIWTLIQGLTEVLFSRYTNHHIGISQLFVNLIIPQQVFWYLLALFLYFL